MRKDHIAKTGTMDISHAFWPFVHQISVIGARDPGLKELPSFLSIQGAVRSGEPLIVQPQLVLPASYAYKDTYVLSFPTIDDVFQFVYNFYLENLPGSSETILLRRAMQIMLEDTNASMEEVNIRLSGLHLFSTEVHAP